MRERIRALVRRLGVDVIRYRPPDTDAEALAIVARARPFTMTSGEALLALIDAARYVADAKLPGAVVECGVWRGGSMMAAALSLHGRGDTGRTLHLFDTFTGMPRPTERDLGPGGRPAIARFEALRDGDDRSDWCRAPEADVRRNLLATGYPGDRLRFVAGKVEDTIPGSAPDRIALLRLDTDWYESTRHEMIHLYPRLVPGGVLILDDYGHWRGSRHAVDEYLTETDTHLLLMRMGKVGRIAIKP